MDYVVLTAELYDRVVEFVGELPPYTDHCPLHLPVNISTNIMDKEHIHVLA